MSTRKEKYGKEGYIDFRRLWISMRDKGIRKCDLIKAGIHPTTLYKMRDNGNVSCETLVKVCHLLECRIQDICEFVDVPKDIDIPEKLIF
jgi:DNA-binding Xre family transcriptional regulator